MKALLLDYGGTLALIDEDQFMENYFFMLNVFLVERYKVALDQADLLDCIVHITRCADGFTNNYERLLKCLSSKVEKVDWREAFEDFYASGEFNELASLVKPNQKVVESAKKARRFGLYTVLAINPIFPKIAVEKQLSWIGLDATNFDHISFMENSHYCKPDPRYYLEICKVLSIEPKDCLMVGDDDFLDGSCVSIGMKYKPVELFSQDGKKDPRERFFD
ncbi:HAD family hydrolase [Pseudothermotoga sp.]|uniref:HAD family hydrolase n=1 Tax=Pseudothermotoga sp. TaxID=2033661 RepID=UPI0031F66F75